MISVLISTCATPGAPPLAADLQAAGIHVLGAVDVGDMVREAVRTAPDLVVCYDAQALDELFVHAESLNAAAPRPMVVFTNDVDAAKIERAARVGIHAYVINGYGAHRLRALIHLAQARFRHDRLLREELADVSRRFEDRKLVDRAKGILMRARQLSEDDAFQLLRTAAMHSKRRLGQVSQHVIAAARDAEAVNRAGQLRMLSQRGVKHYALLLAGIEVSASRARLAESTARIDANLALLAKSLSRPGFDDLIDAVRQPWRALKSALGEAPAAAALERVDALSEQVLGAAETLTNALESAGLAGSLHVINLSGRQRMLSQRLTKLALLARLRPAPRMVEHATNGGMRAARADAIETAAQVEHRFGDALRTLQQLPLRNEAIERCLDAAASQWHALLGGIAASHTRDGLAQMASASEALLDTFETLTAQYESSMQMLIG